MSAYSRSDLLAILKKPTVLCGGFATQAEKLGYTVEDDPKCRLWSSRLLLDNPEACRDVHLSFVQAGAKWIETNTYRAPVCLLANRVTFGEHGAQALIDTAVRAVRLAIDDYEQASGDKSPKIVVGAIGPYSVTIQQDTGDVMHCYTGEYVDTTPKSDMVDYHYRQARALHKAGCDLLGFETIPALAEAQCILHALDRMPADVSAYVTFACKDGASLGRGDSFTDAIKLVTGHEKVIAAGVNCTDPQLISPLLHAASAHRNGKPFVVYPNSGEMYHLGKGWHGFAKEKSELAEMVHDWIEMGTDIIGGCCRIYDDDIALMAKTVAQNEMR